MTSNDAQHASIGTSIMARLSATVVVVCKDYGLPAPTPVALLVQRR
jgi:hypothetical protein